MTLGGAVVIVSVLGILVLILGTTLPLFYPARARLLGEAALPAGLSAEGVLGLGIQSAANDSWLVAHVVDASGKFSFVDLLGQRTIDRPTPSGGNRPRRPGEAVGRAAAGPSDARLRDPTLTSFPAEREPPRDAGASPAIDLYAPLVRRRGLAGQGRRQDRACGQAPPVSQVHRWRRWPRSRPTSWACRSRPSSAARAMTASRCAALYNGKQIVVTRQSEDLSGDKTRDANRSRPGHSRTRDGDCPGSQRHDALCRNGQRVDPLVAS